MRTVSAIARLSIAKRRPRCSGETQRGRGSNHAILRTWCRPVRRHARCCNPSSAPTGGRIVGLGQRGNLRAQQVDTPSNRWGGGSESIAHRPPEHCGRSFCVEIRKVRAIARAAGFKRRARGPPVRKGRQSAVRPQSSAPCRAAPALAEPALGRRWSCPAARRRRLKESRR